MREILFRGKTSGGKWVYGSLIRTGRFCCILEPENSDRYDYPYLDADLGVIDGQAVPINFTTIGQYIGVKDKHGNKIFEGDIVVTKYGRLCTTVWFQNQLFNGWDFAAVLTYHNVHYTQFPDSNDLFMSDNLEVIGNIHDNPELLKGE